MLLNIPHLGEAMAFSTAVVWAFAVILFKKSGENVHPIGLNFFKNSLATVLFLPTLWIMGATLFRKVAVTDYLLLLASGALGIGIADTLFFMCLNRLGAALSAIVDCLYSPFVVSLSFLWLSETMSVWQLLGVAMIVSAVLTAVRRTGKEPISRRDLILGVVLGITAMASMAVGIVIIKPLLNRSPLLWSTQIRLFGGAAILGPLILVHPARRKIMSSIATRESWKYTIPGSFLGAYVAMVLWLAGFKYTLASTASALNQTSNIFVFIFAAIFLRETITTMRTIGIIIGVAGAFLVTFG
jgi:drug/metabolite transporter (DMT)-like permease